MAKNKRRTKNQKANAKHNYISWQKTSKELSGTRTVKGQKKIVPNLASDKLTKNKRAYLSAQDAQLAQIKTDVLKSLTLFGLIAGVEAVLYFFWT